MEISLTPDTYQPIVNNAGEYIDKIPVIKKDYIVYVVQGKKRYMKMRINLVHI